MADEAQPRIRALLEIDNADLIHNDLANAAFHFTERVRKAIEAGEREGVGHDMMAALTMTAFAYEAYLNFVGNAAIEHWDERQSLWKKERQILESLGLEWKENERPRSTTRELRDFRDVLAHGKPVLTKQTQEAEGTDSDLQTLLRNYKPEWETKLDPDFVSRAYEDVEAMWRAMLQAGQINVIETISHGSRTITFLAYAESPKSDATG